MQTKLRICLTDKPTRASRAVDRIASAWCDFESSKNGEIVIIMRNIKANEMQRGNAKHFRACTANEVSRSKEAARIATGSEVSDDV